MRRLAAFLVGLLLATPAYADMYQDASNAKLPEAPVNLGLGYAVKAGGDIQVALTAAAVMGGTVTVAPGLYPIGRALMIGSNTHLYCQQGATIQANAAGWTGNVPGWSGSVTLAHISNVNNDAATITDQNITVEGCNFTMDAAWTDGQLGGFHTIEIRKARNVRVVGNRFHKMGNGTAMLATDGTVVDGNYMTDARNACWDHWEAPKNGVVTESNYCEAGLNGSGAWITGGGTLGEPGIAKNFRLAGTYKISGAAGTAGIWVMGLSPASGVEDVVIDHPIIAYDGSSAADRTCIKVSGSETQRVTVRGPICRYGTISIGGGDDNIVKGKGGIVVDGPLIEGGGTIFVQGSADGVTIRNANIRRGGGTYTHAISIEAAATNILITGNQNIEVGTTGYFDNGAGTNARIDDVPVMGGTWVPDLSFGLATTGITYSSRTGYYWRYNKLACAYFTVVLSSKGSATGIARIHGAPLPAASVAPQTLPAGVTYWANMPGLAAAPFAAWTDTGFILNKSDAASSGALTDVNFAGGTFLYGGGCYPTDAG